MGGFRLYKVGSPYNYSELSTLGYVQSFDTMYLAHLNHKVGKLTRQSNTDWLFSDVAFGPSLDPPASVTVTADNANTDASNSGNAYFPRDASYVVSAVDEASGQESRASVAVSGTNDLTLKRNQNTVTWAAVTGATLYRVFKANITGAFGYIGETRELSFVDDNILADLSDAPLTGDDPFVDPGDYPSSLCFFEQRLFFGRTRNRPNAIYASRSADFENMDRARPLRADDALLIGLASGSVNAVNQIIPADTLLALTSDSIFQVSGTNDDTISPSPPPKIKRMNGRGASDLKALLIDSVTFFQPSIGTEIRTLGFSFEINGLTTNDVSIFSPHFFTNHRIVSWCYAQEPLSVIWAVRDDGKLLAFTWQQEQQVWGWTEMVIDGAVISVTSIPENGEDRVYLIVKRVIDEEERYFVEQMASAKWTSQPDALFLDCARSYLFTEPSTIATRLEHLEGREVWALADGFVVKGLTVVNGAVTLPDAASTIHVGLPVVATAETMPLNFQRADGASIGLNQTTGRAHMRLVDTIGISAGRTDATLEDVVTREDEPLGQQARLFTGIVRVQMDQLVSFESTLVIQQANPLPMRVTAAYLEANATR